MHTEQCANSTASECKCLKGCRTKLHGWRGSHRFGPLVEGRQHVLAHQPAIVSAAAETLENHAGPRTYEMTDYLAAKIALWTVDTMWSDDETDVLVKAFAKCVAPVNRTFIDALAASADLTENDRHRIRSRVGEGHLVCVISVAVLQAYDVFSATLDDIAAAAARELAATVFDSAAEAVARAAAERVFKIAAKQVAALLIDETRVVAVRFIGAVSCPDWDRHPDDGIWTYCLQPALLDALTEKEKRWASEACRR